MSSPQDKVQKPEVVVEPEYEHDDPEDKGTFKYIDPDGKPTNRPFTEKKVKTKNPDGSPGDDRLERTPHRAYPGTHHQTHGTIARNPYAQLDRLNHPAHDAANREVKSTQLSQGGEDPGRVFDAAGANSSSGFRHHTLPGVDTGFGQPGEERVSHKVVPDDSPGTSQALVASSASNRTPVANGGKNGGKKEAAEKEATKKKLLEEEEAKKKNDDKAAKDMADWNASKPKS